MLKSNFEDLSRRVIRSSVDWSSEGLRLIDYLTGRFTYRDASAWCERIADGEILVNGEPAVPEQVLRGQDCIEYFPGDLPEPEADLSYHVVYEDDTMMVVDKSGNLCVHPAGPFFKHTLWHLLCSRYGKIYLVNRLDRETSGLLIAAKNPEAAAKLGSRKWPIRKEYLALVFGEFSSPVDAKGFLIPASGAVHKKRRFVFEAPTIVKGMESAETQLIAEKRVGPYSLVRAIPVTGRLHQIRSTLQSLGFPLVGDKLYGPDETIYLKIREQKISDADRKKLVMARQALHSAKLVFTHPVTGAEIKVDSPLPPDMAKVIAENE